MKERYDFDALASFLRLVIAEHPVFEKIDLRGTKIEKEWRIERIDPPSRMRSGDWVIWDAKQGDDVFQLYFMYDPRNGRSVSIRAKRLAKSEFQLINIGLDEWVEL